MLSNVIDYVVKATSITNRADILADINTAWHTIWTSSDLPGSQWTDVISPDPAVVITALPQYVYALRGFRRYHSAVVTLYSPQMYMGDERWVQFPFEAEVIGTSPLHTSIANAAPVTVSVDDAADEEFAVTIIGETAISRKVRETLTFAAGESSKTTVNSFTNIFSLSKSVVIPLDINVMSADNVEIATIPADAMSARHILIKLREDTCATIINGCYNFKMLFKRRAPILFYDQDEIPEPFEITLQDSTVALIMRRSKDKESQALAEKYEGMAAGNLATQSSNANIGTNFPIKFVETPMFTRYRGHI